MEYRLTEVDDDKCLFHVEQTQFFKLQSNTTPKAFFSFSMTSFTRLPPIPEKKNLWATSKLVQILTLANVMSFYSATH